MEQLFLCILNGIVKDKDKCKVIVNSDENTLKFSVKVTSGDKLNLIGKDGKVINSIRDYLKTVSKKFNKKVYVEVNEN